MTDARTRSSVKRSVLELLATTPLSDVCRGKLTGELGWRGEVARSGLPAEIQRVVRDVVQRTRLWRCEKAEVARELVAHFSDAMDDERQRAQVVKEFGDVRTAARLIRRGRIRMRGPVWKAWRAAWIVAGMFIATIVLTYVIQFVRFHTGKPTIARNFAEEYNAKIREIPQEDRAWPLYRQIMLGMERQMLDSLDQPVEADTRVTDPNWELMRAYLERNVRWLQLAREAASKSHLGYELVDRLDQQIVEHQQGRPVDHIEPPSENPMMMHVLMPHLGELRNLARLLRSDIRFAIEQGDGARIMPNLRAMEGMARHAGETPFIIAGLVRLAIVSLMVDSIREIIESGHDVLATADLTELSHRLAAIRADGSLQINFASERQLFEDVLQRVYTDDGSGNGHLTAEGYRLYLEFGSEDGGVAHAVWGPVAMSTLASRREMKREYDRVFDAVELAASQARWERDESAIEQEFERLDSSFASRQQYMLILLLMPALSRVVDNMDLSTMRVDGAMVMIALELHRRRHGALPDSISELVPERMPGLPRDVFDGKPIRYARRGDSYVLYSIGSDGDDDGGSVGEDAQGRIQHKHGLSVDGDFVLFPSSETVLPRIPEGAQNVSGS